MTRVDVGWLWAQGAQGALCHLWRDDTRWLWDRLDAVDRERTLQEAWAARKYFEATGAVLPYRPSTLDVGRHPWRPDEASCPSGWRPQRGGSPTGSVAEARQRVWWWPKFRRVLALLLLVVLAGCATAPPQPTQAERWAASQRELVAAIRSMETWCKTHTRDPERCMLGVFQVLSRPVVFPAEPPPPQTIIIQQPVSRRRQTYWGPRTPYGVPSVPGIVPVYPIE